MANLLFEWAEKRKVVDHKKWFLFELQQERKLQRSMGKIIFDQTRSSDGSRIEFFGFRLFEIFHYEDFGNLYSGLKSMFPDAEGIESSFFNNFEKIRDSITTGSWTPVGTLINGSYAGFGGARALRQIPSLDEFIDSIEVSVQKILPSVWVLSFDVYLKNNATEKIVFLQSQEYLGEANLNGISFGEFPLIDISLSSPELVLTKTIRDWVSKIRINVEEVVKLHFKGFYLSQITNNHLPSIEVYRLVRSKRKQKDFYSWVENNILWWRSFGFPLGRDSFFSNENLAFSYSLESNNLSRPTSVAFFFQEKFPEQPRFVWGKMKYFLIEITPLTAVSEILTSSRSEIEKRRRVTFDLIKRRNRLSRLIKSYQDTQFFNRTLQRLMLEISQGLLFFGFNTFFNVTELRQTQNRPTKKKVGDSEIVSLNVAMKKNIDYLGKLVTSHVEFVDKEFSSHIEILNVSAIYRLQIITLWLTVAATFLGVIGLLSNYQDIKGAICFILNLFR